MVSSFRALIKKFLLGKKPDEKAILTLLSQNFNIQIHIKEQGNVSALVQIFHAIPSPPFWQDKRRAVGEKNRLKAERARFLEEESEA
jgi:hypothetical protein